MITDQAWERETVIGFNDAEPGLISVWTSQRRIGVWLEKVGQRLGVPVVKTSRPTWDATGLPSGLISLRSSLRKPRPLSDEQRAKLTAKLADWRKGRGK